jgi:hypothetical protein
MTDYAIIFQKAAKRRKIILFSWLLALFLFTLKLASAQTGADQIYTPTFININYKKTASDSSTTLDIFLPDSN